MTTLAEIVPLALLMPVLGAVAYGDMRHMRIPNMLSLIGIAIFVATIPLIGWAEAGLRAAVAAAVFAAGFAAFALRLFGGGDVKMLGALMLVIPSQTLSLYGMVFSVSMLAGIAFILTMRAFPFARRSGWVALRAAGTFPMGISIAASGALHLALIALPA